MAVNEGMEYDRTNPGTDFDLFLIGDTGDIATSREDLVLKCLKLHLQESEQSALVFLGDNVYPRGLPPEGNILRAQAELTLKKHYEILADYEGRVMFIAGNHDWNKGRVNGAEYVLRQEKYLKDLFNGREVFFPGAACPGPREIHLNESIVVIAIDTQWWMQKSPRYIPQDPSCVIDGEDDFFYKLSNALHRNENKTVILVGHHPIYSYAIHGGRFKLKHHIFPLTIYDKDAWIPLPGLGSLIPLYRRFLGAREDMAHPRYRRFRKRMKDVLAAHPGLIYAAGHEHNLQHIEKKGVHFIISGSGSKVKYLVQDGKYLRFGIKHKGFFRLRIKANGSRHLYAWTVDPSGKNPLGNICYDAQL